MPEATETRTEKGISLARGPALILGTILLAAGLYFLYKQHFFPKFSNFPNGKAPVEGKVFGIFGANGWTGMLTAVAGGLLLFGAAQHLLAKTMSLIVGVALAAAAIIALASGDVLGLAAANGWTELAWGVAAAILLFNTVIPRRRTTRRATQAASGGGKVAQSGQRQGAVRRGPLSRIAALTGVPTRTSIRTRGGTSSGRANRAPRIPRTRESAATPSPRLKKPLRSRAERASVSPVPCQRACPCDRGCALGAYSGGRQKCTDASGLLARTAARGRRSARRTAPEPRSRSH